jgi:hypothetical protein
MWLNLVTSLKKIPDATFLQLISKNVLQVVTYIYIWLERNFHKLYSELYNVLPSALSKELENKNLVQAPFLP